MATAPLPDQAPGMLGSGGPECPQVDRMNCVFQRGGHGPNGLRAGAGR
jgi:hypothetical protein